MDKARAAVAFPKLLPPLDEQDRQRCEDIAQHRMELAGRPVGAAQRIRAASMGLKSGKFLTRLVKHLQPNSIFEIGTCAGIGAAYLCSAALRVTDDVRFVGLELVPEKIAMAYETLGKFCPAAQATIIEGHFDDTFERGIEMAGPLEFVYLDGRHKKKYTIDMFNRCVDAMDYGIIVCDDLRIGAQGNTVHQLRGHSRVSVSFMMHGKDVFSILPR